MEAKRSSILIHISTHFSIQLGIILSGSPYSVYDHDAPRVDPEIFNAGVPILGICYGLQELAWTFKGKVDKSSHREYGFAQLKVIKLGSGFETADALFDGLDSEMQVEHSNIIFILTFADACPRSGCPIAISFPACLPISISLQPPTPPHMPPLPILASPFMASNSILKSRIP